MMQFMDTSFVIVYLSFLIVLCIVSFSIVIAIQRISKWAEKEDKGVLASWWKWINIKDTTLRTRVMLPDSTKKQHLESYSCPVCGSMLSKKSIERLEYGYNVECEYCGATIRSPKMNY